MKKLTPILSILTLFVTQALSGEPRTLTIHGTVDPRLDVSFMSTYRGTNIDRIECSDMNPSTGRRKVKLAGLSKHVTTTDYNITMPIDYTDANECGYEFVSIDLIMRRKYDNDLSSIHPVLSKEKKVSPIYWKTKGGEMSSPNTDTPAYLQTDKKHFSLAKESTFLCKTFWFDKRRDADAHSQFHCTMQIDDDINRTLYQKDPDSYIFSHPEFGVDTIKNETMHIDIVVDEKNCQAMENKKVVPDHFRELEKPNLFQKLF